MYVKVDLQNEFFFFLSLKGVVYLPTAVVGA